MASNLRRTDDLQRLKVRELVLQGTDGSYPTQGGLPYISNTTGLVAVSDGATVDASGNMVANTLDVAGAIQAGTTVSGQTAHFDDVIVDTNLGIGVGSAVHALDVKGQVYISGTSAPTNIFTIPGLYTIRIPANAGTATVTLVGAGGYDSAGGRGGYIRGTFNTTAYVGQTLTIQVGAAGSLGPPTSYVLQPATASFISFLPGGPVLAMAGSGGASAQSGSVTSAGGHGGGGLARFTAVAGGSVAIGTDGQTVGGAGGGQGGQTSGGGAGGGAVGFGSTPGPNGSGRPGVETYVDVVGGYGGPTIAGGNGYTSGGAGGVVESPGLLQNGGGGGGSSYVNSVFTVSSSFRGDDAGYSGAVPTGFGQAGQGGYVSISYTTQPSLYTTGDIVSGAGLRISAPAAPTNATDPGSTGQIAWDSNYIYVCIAPSTWKRVALTTWP